MISSYKTPDSSDLNVQDPKASTNMLKNDPKVIRRETNIVRKLTGCNDSDVQLNDTGWTSRVYIIDSGKIVFKFPRTEAVKKEYIQEIKIYRLLEQMRTELQVPKLRWDHTDNDYFGYEGIIGKQLTPSINGLSLDTKRQLGKDIGQFLKQLHELDIDEPHVMTIEDEICQAQEKYARCVQVIQKSFTTEEVQKIDEFICQRMPSIMRELGEETRLCHGDLGYWNLILKKDASLGVIDFGDIGYYDHSKDFCGLKDETMLEAALESYGDDETLRQKIDIRQKFLPFFDLQYFTASHNGTEIKKTLAIIRTSLLN